MIEMPADQTYCQSCAMPLGTGADPVATNADGSPNDEYCGYCYQNGAWTAPNITMSEMVEHCVPPMVETGQFTPEEARSTMVSVLPTLKRWSGK
jgi:hypothetical protein